MAMRSDSRNRNSERGGDRTDIKGSASIEDGDADINSGAGTEGDDVVTDGSADKDSSGGADGIASEAVGVHGRAGSTDSNGGGRSEEDDIGSTRGDVLLKPDAEISRKSSAAPQGQELDSQQSYEPMQALASTTLVGWQRNMDSSRLKSEDNVGGRDCNGRI